MEDTGIIEELKAELTGAMEQLKEYNTLVQSLSKEITFPLAVTSSEPMIITGVALASGLWKGVYYSPEELKKEAENMKKILLKLPLIVEHGKSEKYGTRQVGEHLDFYYEPTLESLVYKAKVTDPEAMKDIKSGKLFGTSMKTDMKAVTIGGLTKGFRFIPLENSLTASPACDKCVIFSKKQGDSRVLSLHKYLNNKNILKSKRGVMEMSNQEETPGEEKLTIRKEDVLALPKKIEELSNGTTVKADVMSLKEALEQKRDVIYKIEPGEYSQEALDFVIIDEEAKPKYPKYKYYPYKYKYKYPKKKKMSLDEILDTIILDASYKSFMKECMKEEGMDMKKCAAKWKQEKSSGESSEELAKKPVTCPVDGKEFTSFAAFKKHWNDEHAAKYGDYKTAKKLFKSLADKTFKKAFSRIVELSEESPGEEAKPEEEKPSEEEPAEEAKPEEKKPAEEAKPTGEEPGEEEKPAEEEKKLTAEELIKKAREKGYKPGELFAEMEIETWKEG